MEVVAERYVNWKSPGATEDEDIVEKLIERKPKHRIATSFDSVGGESGISEEVSEIENQKLDTWPFDEGEEETENVPKQEGAELVDEEWSGKNVYFDKASGIWKCHHCTWTYKIARHVDDRIRSPKHSHLLTNFKTVDHEMTSNYKGTGFSNGTSGVQTRSTYVSVSENGSSIQSSEVTEESVTTTIQESHTIITTQHKTIKDFDTEPVYHSSLSVQANGSQNPSLNSAVNGNGHVPFSNQNDQEYHIRKDSTDELGDILEGDSEPIDYNVEEVLKKQETHNLICPNCHSCITRRVILKKRKRVIKDVQPDSKRDKTEITGDSEISPPEVIQETGDESSANMVNAVADGQNDVITCWSCFSLLIPSGKGFKLFKVFGSRRQPEVASMSNSNQTLLSASDNGGTSVDHGNTVNTVQPANANAVDQKPQKGGDYKLFWSYGNSRDDNVNNSHQGSTSQTSQFTTSAVETTNAQGTTTLSNRIEVSTIIKQTNGVENSKQTNSSSLSSNGLSSMGTHHLATRTEIGLKGPKTEAGSNIQNASSTIMYSRDEYQININDKPGTDFDSLKDREPLKSEDIVSVVQGSTLLENLLTDLEKVSNSTISSIRDDVRISIQNVVNQDVSSGTQDVTRDIVIPETETQAHGRAPVVQVGDARDWDVLKSIVYGGLIESITSLGVVSSAAGAETATLNVLALGVANLIGGLILIFHSLKDLKKSAVEGPSNQVDRYYETLGRRNHITLHAVVVVLSFIIFGLIPIVTYTFTFRASDNRDYKSLAVIGASLVCVSLLSMGKAHTKNPLRTARPYFNSITYYLSIAIAASGLSYIAGKLLQEFIEKTGWFDTTSSLNSIVSNTEMPLLPAWGSY